MLRSSWERLRPAGAGVAPFLAFTSGRDGKTVRQGWGWGMMPPVLILFHKSVQFGQFTRQRELMKS